MFKIIKQKNLLKMLDKKDILNLIYKQIMEIDDEDVINDFKKFDFKEDYPLIGAKTLLDSMDLVTLIISVEAEINKNYPNVKIASDDAMAERSSPFKSPKSISEYVIRQL